MKTNKLKIKTIKLTLFLIFFPDNDLLISFPLTINKLEIALIKVSIVLNVSDKAKIKPSPNSKNNVTTENFIERHIEAKKTSSKIKRL